VASKDKYFAYAEAVFNSDLSSHSKIILLAVADHYNWTKNTPAYPSFPTLAKKTSLSINTVRSHVKALNESGWLQFAGFKIIENIKLNQWKPTVPPHQISALPHQKDQFTPTNWEPDFGVKQIINIDIYKQRRSNKERKQKVWQGFSALSKMKLKGKN
jgi:hypothetical protein